MLNILTIALDAMPFLPRQLEVFSKLNFNWRWLIAEGAADNTHDTRWCKPQELRLSRDGSTEWINANLCSFIKAWRKQLWDGKVEMTNTPLRSITEPCVLIQIDADEFWTAEQLTEIHALLRDGPYVRAYFACRYFVAPDIVVLPENDPVHNVWLRAWRFTPGDSYVTHEPPNLKQQAKGATLTHVETRARGLVFDHFSYFYEHQVRYKGEFYGYPRAVEHWKRLQRNTQFPVKLNKFLPWAKEGALATRL